MANDPSRDEVRRAEKTALKLAGEIIDANDWLVGWEETKFIQHFTSYYVVYYKQRWARTRTDGNKVRTVSEEELHTIITSVCNAVWKGPPPRELKIPGGRAKNGRGVYIYPTPASIRLFTNGYLLGELDQRLLGHMIQSNASEISGIKRAREGSAGLHDHDMFEDKHVKYSTPPPPQGTSISTSHQGRGFITEKQRVEAAATAKQQRDIDDLDAVLDGILSDPRNDPRNQKSASSPSNWTGTATAWGKSHASGQGRAFAGSSSSSGALRPRASNSALQTGSPPPQPHPLHSAAPQHGTSRTLRAIAPAPTGTHRAILPATTSTPHDTTVPAAVGGRGYGQGAAHPNLESRGRGGNSRGRGRGS